jgi:YgiT-type zinc finger domain-containing protein
MSLISQCPICGAELSVETVEKLVRGGRHMAAVKARAGVCRKCGEIVFDADTVERFEALRARLSKNEVADLTPMGNAYSA